MEQLYNSDDFLAKWADGTISEEEKEAFKKSEDYKYYRAILEGTELLELPIHDKEALFKEVQLKKNESITVKPLIPKWTYAVAASILLILGTVYFFNNTTSFETSYGEQLAISLPDSSKAILNARSKLRYKKKNWKDTRLLSLSGEAYFDVAKGTTFTVNTKNGTVTVLGTQFTVNSAPAIFEVVCYEGSVKVLRNELTKTLVKGEGVRLIDDKLEGWTLDQELPSWLQDESSFNRAPLLQVIRALEKQYDIVININNVDKNLRFTGSFTHRNLETALRTVFESLEIKFTFKDENTIDLVIE